MEWSSIVDLFAVAWGVFLIVLPRLSNSPRFIVRDGTASRCLGGLFILIRLFSLARHVAYLRGLLSSSCISFLNKLRILSICLATGVFVFLGIRVFCSRGSQRK